MHPTDNHGEPILIGDKVRMTHANGKHTTGVVRSMSWGKQTMWPCIKFEGDRVGHIYDPEQTEVIKL